MTPSTELQDRTVTDAQKSSADLTILYGSQSGNAEYLAYEVSQSAEALGMSTDLLTLNDALKDENIRWNRLLIVTATHDNGHMPDNAQAFWDWIQTVPEGQYAGLPYSVLSIGDSMYDDFCKAGLDLDGELQRLGAKRITDTIECDVDHDMTAPKWVETFLAQAQETAEWDDSAAVGGEAAFDTSDVTIAEAEPLYSARVRHHRILSGPGSNKRVIHYEIAFEEGFSYLPGDSVDVFPSNPAPLVQEWLREFPETTHVTLDGVEVDFKEALEHRVELRLPHLGLAIALSERVPESPISQEVPELFEARDRHVITKWLWNRDVIDIILEIGAEHLGATELLSMLRPIQHRAYSIASSPNTHPDEVHLTVGHITFTRDEREHVGCASAFLDHLAESGQEFSIRRAQAHDFRLPNTDAPVIMIGPGVGVAPFIGFLHELAHTGRGNRSWLFFGDQRRKYDWIYRDEMETWLDTGILTRLNLAFSRDSDEKHYVQHEIRENADELRRWVDDGAYIFVCGDKDRMAHDVEDALVEILGQDRVDELKTSLKYVKDVY